MLLNRMLLLYNKLYLEKVGIRNFCYKISIVFIILWYATLHTTTLKFNPDYLVLLQYCSWHFQRSFFCFVGFSNKLSRELVSWNMTVFVQSNIKADLIFSFLSYVTYIWKVFQLSTMDGIWNEVIFKHYYSN